MLKKYKLTRDLYLMITFSGLRNISDLFFGTFFISYIMQLATNEILAVSTYKLFEFTATAAGFFLFANWCKKYGKVSVFALNLVPKVLLLMAIILLGDNVVNYIMPLGLLYGIGASMYHLPMNSMTGEKVPAHMMGRYIGIKSAIIYTVKILAPIILGLFITVGSYTEMAYVLLGLTVVELVLMCFFTKSRHGQSASADFAGFFRCMLRFPIIRGMFMIEGLRGFAIGLMDTIVPMYTVYMFHTDLNLGIFTTIFSMISIVCAWLFGKYARREMYPKILGACMAMILIGVGLFVTWTVPATFVLYNFVYATAIKTFSQINDVTTFNVSKSKCMSKNHRIEYFVFRDFALFIGRWIGFVGLMYIGVFGGYEWLRWYLLVITAALIMSCVFLAKLAPHVRNR